MGITTESSTLTATVVLTLFMGLVIGRVLKRFSSLPIVSSSSQPTASKSSQETHIVETNAILLLLSSIEELGAKELTEGFCGVVATDTSRLPELTGKSNLFQIRTPFRFELPCPSWLLTTSVTL